MTTTILVDFIYAKRKVGVCAMRDFAKNELDNNSNNDNNKMAAESSCSFPFFFFFHFFILRIGRRTGDTKWPPVRVPFFFLFFFPPRCTFNDVHTKKKKEKKRKRVEEAEKKKDTQLLGQTIVTRPVNRIFFLVIIRLRGNPRERSSLGG